LLYINCYFDVVGIINLDDNIIRFDS